MIDYNAFVGRWPFYALPYDNLEELARLHGENGIDGGYVSSVDSIFYNDFYDSEYELSKILEGTPYRHVVTPNPSLVEAPLTLSRCISEFNVKGIRLHPEFHGFRLTDECVKPILDIARRHKLPIFVTARMHDERVSHIIHPRKIELDEVRDFVLANGDLKILLCGFKPEELVALTPLLLSEDNLFAETSSSRNNLFGKTKSDYYKKMVFGSGYPLVHVLPGVLRVSELEGEVRDIFFGRGDVFAE